MKTVRNHITSLIAVYAMFALSGVVALQAEDKKADTSGTWTWTSPARGDRPERKSTLTLKQDGAKLTGKLSRPGRDGTAREAKIEEGKVKDGELSFKITREFGDRKFVLNYKGKVSGDTLKGKRSFERNGETSSRDWVAKRAPAKK